PTPTDPTPSTPPPDGRYEAENSPATCDGAIESEHAGFSGTGFCNTENASGAAAQFTITAGSGGPATLEIGYANGTSSNRAANVGFGPTGAWTNWSTVTVTAPVNSGNNTVRLVATTGDGLANIDYLDVDVSGGGPSPTNPPTTSPPSQPGGTNLSIGAGSDGSSKASGTSYGNVRDGDMGTYWSPNGSTGRISIKWDSNTTVATINIREAAGSEGNIGSWQVVNHDNGAVLATGSGA